MPLKNDWASGELFTAGDQNDVADAVNAVAPYPVDVYGADPTGASFSDTAVDAAITAMGTSPGILVFGVGTYKVNSTKTLAYPGQGIEGRGIGATTIDYRGTGDCLRVWDSTVPTDGSTSPGAAGPITGLHIVGDTNSNSNICGLHIGDLMYIHIDDVRIEGFNNAGSKNFWGENRYSWSERAYIRMSSENGTDNYVFESNASHPLGWTSWDYSTYILSSVTYIDQNAVTIKRRTQFLGVDLTIVANTAADVANTGVFLTVGVGSGDDTEIQGHLQISAEIGAHTGLGPKAINMGPNALIYAEGSISFAGYSGSYQAGTVSWSQVEFTGPVWCPGLTNISWPTNVITNPKVVGSFYDPLGKQIFRPASNTNAVNSLVIENKATGGTPVIGSEGSDTHIGIQLVPQGDGDITIWANSPYTPTITAAGGATNVDLNLVPQGTGKVKANNVDVVTLTGAQTQTNKTLTDPRVSGNGLLDSNGNVILYLTPTTSAVNQFQIINAAGTSWPTFAAVGSATDVGIWLQPKGTGPVQQWAGSQTSATWGVDGSQTNIDANITTKGAGRVKANGVTVPTIASTDTLTLKRVTPRIGTTTSSATPTINTDTVDQFNITALAAAITSMTTNLSGTPTDGQRLSIRIKGDATPRAITWGASFQSSGSQTLLATTAANKTHMIRFTWDSVVSKWVCDYVDATGY